MLNGEYDRDFKAEIDKSLNMNNSFIIKFLKTFIICPPSHLNDINRDKFWFSLGNACWSSAMSFLTKFYIYVSFLYNFP